MFIPLICMLLMVSGSLFVVCSMNWLFIWLGLEINLFGMLILMKGKSAQKNLEGSVKYFIVQVFSSMLLLLFIFVNYWSFLFLPFLIKMSSVPFHFWFIPVLKNLEWWDVFLLTTWQKFAPLLMMINISLSKSILLILVVTNSFFGSMMGLLQVKIKKILGYSSIYHFSWLLLLLGTLKYLLVMYLLMYACLNYCLVKIFNFLKIINIFKILSVSNFNKLFIMMSFISLSGLPPFFGFFLKWYMMNSILFNSSLVLIMLLLMSIINLYFYFQFIISGFIINSSFGQMSKISLSGSLMFLWFILFIFWY